MEIRASTVYTLKERNIFSNLNVKTGKNPKNRMRNLWLLSAGLILAAVFGLFAFEADLLMWAAILIILVEDLILYVIRVWGPKKAYQREGSIKSDFTFYDDEFEVCIAETGCVTTSRVRYDRILKGIESREYFILYDRENMCRMVDKSTLSDGDIERLRRKFVDVLPKGSYMMPQDW